MFKASFVRLLCVLVALAWASAAQAQTVHTISGTSQFNIGNGLPIPHPAFGGAQATANAHVTTSGAGATLMMPPNKVTHGFNVPQPGINQPVLLFNPNVWQVYTNLTLRNGQATWSADARTPAGIAGPISFCAGQTAAVQVGNPGCLTTMGGPVVTLPSCTTPANCPGAGTMMVQPFGRVRYNRTAGNLGGAARGNTGGTFDVALNPGGANAVGAFIGGIPNATAAIGGSFGVVNQRAVPIGIIRVVTAFTAGGAITGLGATLPTPAPPNNTLWSFGAPWTAGNVTISQMQNIGAPPYEVFVLQGSDTRGANGNGNITLVSGSFSNRSVTSHNGNRGRLSITLPEPSAIAGAAGALLMLLGCHQLVRRRSK